MKKFYLSILICLAGVMSARAEKVLINGLYYNISNNGGAVVTYKGTTESDQASYAVGEVTIPAHVTYNSRQYEVTEIGTSAFENCTQMTKLVIAERYKRESDSFASFKLSDRICYNCRNLEEVVVEGTPVITIAGGMQFQTCVALTKFTCDGSATGLMLKFGYGSSDGMAFFANCTSLQTIVLPRGINKIPQSCFAGCGSLTEVTMGGDYAGAYYDNVNQTYIITQIGDYAFESCPRLAKVYINVTDLLPNITDNSFADIPSNTQIIVNCNIFRSYRIANRWKDLNMVGNLPDFIIESADDAKGAVSIVKAPDCSDGSARITASPNAGYVFEAWMDANNGNLVFSYESDLRLKESQTSSDIHLIANWKEANCATTGTYPYQFDVVNSDASKGSVVVSHYPDCEDGSASMRASAYAGYAFAGWTDALNGNLLVSSESELTLAADYINKNMSLVANWEEANCSTNGVFPYRLEIESANSLQGAVAMYKLPDCDDPSARISASGFAGYTFEAWVDANNGNLIYSNEAVTYIANVDRDLHLVAHFVEADCESNGTFPYMFTAWSNDETKGMVHLLKIPDSDDKSGTIGASAKSGYRFVTWSDGNQQPNRFWDEVNENVVLGAIFTGTGHSCESDGVFGYLFQIESNDILKGIAVMTRMPDCADNTTTIKALPNEGFEFVRWSDGDKNATRTITVIDDTYLQALFQDPENPISEGVENVTDKGTKATSRKFISNGQLFIELSDKTYNAQGVRVE